MKPYLIWCRSLNYGGVDNVGPYHYLLGVDTLKDAIQETERRKIHEVNVWGKFNYEYTITFNTIINFIDQPAERIITV